LIENWQFPWELRINVGSLAVITLAVITRLLHRQLYRVFARHNLPFESEKRIFNTFFTIITQLTYELSRLMRKSIEFFIQNNVYILKIVEHTMKITMIYNHFFYNHFFIYMFWFNMIIRLIASKIWRHDSGLPRLNRNDKIRDYIMLKKLWMPTAISKINSV